MIPVLKHFHFYSAQGGTANIAPFEEKPRRQGEGSGKPVICCIPILLFRRPLQVLTACGV
jgi:hypothetical protein